MKNIYLIFIASILLTNIHVFSQQLPTNYFEGKLIHDQQELTFIFEARYDMDSYTTLMYIPEQLIYAKKANRTFCEKDSIHIQFKDFQAFYSGRIDKQQMQINGNWVQGGQSFPMTLYFKTPDEAQLFKRPQEPKEPFPYFVREISIPNKKEKIQLHGTLTLPDTSGIHTLVILISGSGPQDRNEEIAGHKPFLVIADYLTRNGIAVFRYDDRGVGKSEGDYGAATTEDFMNDALSVVSYFKKYPNINPGKIGLMGHSEGGLVAMMAAAKNKNIPFIISLAGPGVTMVDLLLKQTEDIMRAARANEDFIELTRVINFQMYNLALSQPNPDSLMNKMEIIISEATADFSPEEAEKYGLTSKQLSASAIQLYTPWMRYFLAIKPSDYLRKIKCPVLALNGSLDIQVSADENLDAINRYLTEAKNPHFRIVKIERLNHLFQYVEKGTLGEYMLTEETFNEKALMEILDFIKNLPGK
jgi:uncharacterized protein